MTAPVARDLLTEARRVNERRLLVLTGTQEATLGAASDVIDGTDIDPAATKLIGRRAIGGIERIEPERAGSVLGTTAEAIVVDAHAGLDPNVIGRTVGAVDGGGLFVLCCPSLADWPRRRDPFDATLAVPPFTVDAVAGRFRERFVETLRVHPGIAIVEAETGRVHRDGLTHPAPRRVEDAMTLPEPAVSTFPKAAYEACRTQDQVDALDALGTLADPGHAAVVEADRGRGKSSVAGLAAGAFAAAGDRVLVTAPRRRGAREVFARAEEYLDATGDLTAMSGDPPTALEAAGDGGIEFVAPTAIADRLDRGDLLVVDEAAGLGVDLLATCLGIDRVAFVTTVHGYEGAGRGFSVRFRDRLAASDLAVTDVRLDEPIRYAAGDPIEVWAFRALLLNAGPAPDQLLADATPETVTYRRLAPQRLRADEALLREAFGLLVLAHYRTEPADLARMLDAPNVDAHALVHRGHVASVALVAGEGGLPASLRREMYEGARVRGNMIPDVLTTQLRDERAGAPIGRRVMRIATHAAARSRGLGSALIDRIRDGLDAEVDWLGTGYGATSELLGFWRANGFGTVHLSLTRNETSGEHSVVMLSPCSEAGERLHDRHAEWFLERTVATLTDAHAAVDPALVRTVLGSVRTGTTPALSPEEWRHVAGMAYGPGLVDIDPRPFRRLGVAHLVDPDDPALLTDREERLLIGKVLQGRPIADLVDRLGFPSRRQALRALADAYRRLTEAYGDEAAEAERDRYDAAGDGEA